MNLTNWSHWFLSPSEFSAGEDWQHWRPCQQCCCEYWRGNQNMGEGWKIQAGSPTCGRRTQRRSGEGSDWPPWCFKASEIAAALGGGVLRFTGGKVIQKKKKTENDWEAHFQLSSSPQPNWQKNAVKNQTLLIIDTSMSILMRTFAAVGHSVGFQNMIILKQWLQILKWDWTVIRGYILLFAGY